jgi:hypothetical protein
MRKLIVLVIILVTCVVAYKCGRNYSATDCYYEDTNCASSVRHSGAHG